MRPSALRLAVRPVPLSSVAPNLLRLPPKPAPKASAALVSASPTIDRLIANLAKRAAPGLDAAALAALPPNLRVDEFVPKRREYAGVNKAHRTLLQRLRREA